MGMRRCRVMGGTANSVSTSVGPRSKSNMIWFYTTNAPGMKISLTIVLVMSLCFIAIVVALHVFGKIYRAKVRAGP
ncbi:hypothetical protein J1N35_008465 [Gossypium stocksii]|uniref:Protein transport protein Sec61 subunit beta n=1 Tax=Gossypium stocksii TaxID=47602 RepID=A0A9D3W8W9_9ROSI|nr:hypothetical protein J1N35_008465 [Gossypium stocksii]